MTEFYKKSVDKKKFRTQKSEDKRQRIEGRRQKIGVKCQTKKKWKVSLKIPRFLIPKDEPIVPRAFTPIDYAGGITVFFICWLVYLHTLTPTVGLHDSGDMIVSAYLLGISHPPGYPLYCLLGKLWITILPLGNIAYRMNLASALCASLACMMVYFITLKVARGEERGVSEEGNNRTSRISSLIPAAVVALMLAFATTFWEQAVIAEKYTLNALFATVLIFILLKWHEAVIEYQNSKFKIQNPKFYLYLFAFTLGLSFTHHLQTIFLVPASIFFIIVVCWQNRKYSSLILHPSSLAKMICFFVLPLFLYLYLPVRASTHPLHNWGDPSTFTRLIAHLTAEEYRGRYFTSTDILGRLGEHLTTLFSLQWAPFILIIGLIGAIFFLLKKRLIFIFLFLIFAADSFYSIHYTILNIEDYYIPSYVILSIFLGYGIGEISKLSFKFIPALLHTPYLLVLLLIPFFLFKHHYFQQDKSKYYFAYDYGVNIINYLEPNSIIFLKGDAVFFPYWYLQYVEKKREDLISIFTPYLDKDWHVEEIKRKYPKLSFKEIKSSINGEQIQKERVNKIITQNIDSYPVYALIDESIPTGLSKIPANIFHRVIKSKDEERFSQNMKEVRFNLRGIHNKKIYQDDWRTKDEIISNYAGSYNNFGMFYSQKGETISAIREFKKAIEVNPDDTITHSNLARAYLQINNIDMAIEEFHTTSKLAPADISLHNDLGSLYAQKGRYDEAMIEFQQAIKLDPNDIKAHQNLASVYYNQKRYNEAITECNLILKINPENTYIKQMLLAISTHQ